MRMIAVFGLELYIRMQKLRAVSIAILPVSWRLVVDAFRFSSFVLNCIRALCKITYVWIFTVPADTKLFECFQGHPNKSMYFARFNTTSILGY